MSETAGTSKTGPELRSVVLLEKAPTGIGAVLELLQPGAAARYEDFPLSTVTLVVNGTDMTLTVVQERLDAREFDYAVSQSLLRTRVDAAAARHQGYVILSVDAGDDVFGASALLSNVTATIADDQNGLDVWLPDADLATTDVMYTGEVSQQPALTWFHTAVARLDEATAIAHTIGVRHLGGDDVQLRTSQDPAYAYSELRSAVATLLEDGQLPAEGATLMVDGVPHVLTRAASLLGMGQVLDAIAVEQSGLETKKPQRGWFGRR